MYFDLTDEQQAIKEAARGFLARGYGSERRRELVDTDRGFEDQDWTGMAELGWTGLALPEGWGGQGLGIVRSLGRHGIPSVIVDDETSIARTSRFAAGTVRVTGDRLYTLLSGARLREGLLELRFSPGVQAYAFTFG